MRYFHFLLFFMFLFFLNIKLKGEVVQYDVQKISHKKIPFMQACSEAGIGHLLIVDKSDASTLNCMGTKLDIYETCKKKVNLP